MRKGVKILKSYQAGYGQEAKCEIPNGMKANSRIFEFLPVFILCASGLKAEPLPATLFDHLVYQPSLQAGESTPDGNLIRGTEIVAMVPFQGRLYASTSLWMERDPNIPKACQILALDSPRGKWKVDHQFGKKHLRLTCLKPITFTTDGKGKAIRPVPILLAAPDTVVSHAEDAGVSPSGEAEIYCRGADQSSPWTAMVLGKCYRYSSTRAIGFHRDAVTGVDLVFAGNSPLGNIRGVYDPHAPGRIRWDATPELSVPAGERVMGYCDCNGACYCATTNRIFRRTDGPSPSWQQIYFCPEEKNAVGIRGLTSVPNPSGKGESLLFMALRKVRHLDVNGYKETIEVDMPEFITGQWGVKVSAGMGAYNEFLPYTLPATGEKVWLFGFESAYSAAVAKRLPPDFRLVEYDNPPRHFDARAFYFIRRVNHGIITFEAKEITDPRKLNLVSVRTIVVSPFAEDHGRAFYLGGYDCNKIPSHNTAWIYRAETDKGR